jgi:hypothetical protein
MPMKRSIYPLPVVAHHFFRIPHNSRIHQLSENYKPIVEDEEMEGMNVLET